MTVYRMGKIVAAVEKEPQFLNDTQLALNAARILYPLARESVKRGNCPPEVAEWLLRVEERLQNVLDLVN